MGIEALNSETQFKLTITMTTDAGSMAVAPDATPTVAIVDSSAVSTALTVTAGDTGIFTTLWTPIVTGEFTLTWTFLIDGDPYTDVEEVVVLEVTSSTGSAATVVPPSIGEGATCEVTATFLDARGDELSGVLVRFSPETPTNQRTSHGFVAKELTETSGSDGLLSMYLIRGLTGTVSVSGIGLVRRVTIPDASTIDLFTLTSTSPDPFEVLTMDTVDLVRRS